MILQILDNLPQFTNISLNCQTCLQMPIVTNRLTVEIELWLHEKNTVEAEIFTEH